VWGLGEYRGSFLGLMREVGGSARSASRYFRVPSLSAGVSALELLREPKRFTILVRRGIDLAARGEEVRKLVCHGFSARIHASGLGFDDVMQHIMIKILSNNRGKGAWDPSRSSFSHYVYMVTGCVLSNLEGKARKRRSRERVGLVGYSDGESSGMDVGSLDRSLLMGTEGLGEVRFREEVEALSERLKTSGARYGDLARRILPMVVKGNTRSEIAEQTGVKLYRVGRAMRDIRDVCKSGGGSSAGGASLPR
jgi:hypothetical protein